MGSKENYSNSGVIIPSRFKDSSQQRAGRANRALRPGGPADLLFQVLKAPHFYSPTYKHLGLDVAFTHRELIYDAAVLAHWLKAIRQEIAPPFMYKFEVGKEGHSEELHPHLIAEKNAGLPWIPRGGEIIKPVRAGTEKTLLKYVYKPPVPYGPKALIDFNKASLRLGKQGKAVPRISGYIWY